MKFVSPDKYELESKRGQLFNKYVMKSELKANTM